MDQPVPPPQIEGYEILNEVAAAGQGRVWRARQLSTRRVVALKVPRGDLLRSRAALTRFEREVELTARLSHLNIARIYDSGIHQGLYYYAMELIDGVWLDTYVREHSLSQPEILGLMRTICDAIQHAHQNGVLHRDLKPSNILVTPDGQPHVVDFGLARAVAGSNPAGTTSLDGEVTGTPAYMSPEQAAGLRDQLDTRTDVYSLGVVFYRLITGGFPYEVSTSMLQTLRNIQECDPIRPSKIVPRLDRDIEAILLTALAKEPERRYQSVAELRGDLERYLAGKPILARCDSSLYLLRKMIVRHRYTSTVAALLLVIVLGFLCFSLQLGARLRQTRRELGAEKKSSVERTAEFMRYAQLGMFVKFLDAWHRADRQSAEFFAQPFARGTREAVAVQFLNDPRPLADKIPEFRQRLQAHEPCFVEFIIAEHYLKDGNVPQARGAYQVCLSHPDLKQEDPWLEVLIRGRLGGLTGRGGSVGPPAPGEGGGP
jgi:hypothetical protein